MLYLTDPVKLEHCERSLWLLGFAMNGILLGGTALFMYPTVFPDAAPFQRPSLGICFIVFCGLSALVMIWLAYEKNVISHGRQQLAAEQRRILYARLEDRADRLGTWPGLDSFRSRWEAEQRFSFISQQPFSVLIVALDPRRDLHESPGATESSYDPTGALTQVLRSGDCVYQWAPGRFCIILPGLSKGDAQQVANRVQQTLRDSPLGGTGFSFDVRAVTQPEDAVTLREVEEALLASFPGTGTQASLNDALTVRMGVE